MSKILNGKHFLGQKSPWTKVCLDNCVIGQKSLGILCLLGQRSLGQLLQHPFIRVSHVPRSPNLKLVGGSVCIEADINHTVRRLQINPETIIPVSFKRKLSYTGYYLEQVIKKVRNSQFETSSNIYSILGHKQRKCVSVD